jgi:hypothetical protein
MLSISNLPKAHLPGGQEPQGDTLLVIQEGCHQEEETEEEEIHCGH